MSEVTGYDRAAAAGSLDQEHSMGSNRRYAESLDRLSTERQAAAAMREHEPTSLTTQELDLDEEPLTRAPKPRPVSAWVRYGPRPVLIDAEAVAWTDHAVAIRWRTPDGREDKAWVWSSAVRARR
jgi:hypothetical protein